MKTQRLITILLNAVSTTSYSDFEEKQVDIRLLGNNVASDAQYIELSNQIMKEVNMLKHVTSKLEDGCCVITYRGPLVGSTDYITKIYRLIDQVAVKYQIRNHVGWLIEANQNVKPKQK